MKPKTPHTKNLAARTAKSMGWVAHKTQRNHALSVDGKGHTLAYWVTPTGNEYADGRSVFAALQFRHCDIWDPTSDYNHSQMVVSHCVSLGLYWLYKKYIRGEVVGNRSGYVSEFEVERLVTIATPEQQTRAAYAAIRKLKPGMSSGDLAVAMHIAKRKANE